MSRRTLSVGLLACLLSAGLNASAGGGSAKQLVLEVVTIGPAASFCVEMSRPQPRGLTLVYKNVDYRCYQDDRHQEKGAFLSLGAVRKAVQALGGKLIEPKAGLYEYEVTFPDGRFFPHPAFRRAGQTYFTADEFFTSLVTVRGEDTELPEVTLMPDGTLRSGGKSVRLSDTSRPFFRYNLSFSVAIVAAQQLIHRLPESVEYMGVRIEYPELEGLEPTRTYRTGLRAGEIVLALQLGKPDIVLLQIVTIGKGGKMKLKTEQEPTFVTSGRALKVAAVGQRVPTLLVRLTGVPLNNLKSGIFLPKP